MPFSAQQIRQKFLAYFEAHGHKIVKSSALVPHNDPTLLFTNAGMVQFKDAFTGKEKRDYTRAVTSQKCVRAGGKHNDLENVGVTARHHTFFEMLGNFSFGDYFKQDAIKFAWDFVTNELGIDKERLCVTVFKGENGVPADDEAAALWRAQGVPAERLFRLGAKDNFWSMGDTGPCGPCSELHFYQGTLDPNDALAIFDTPAADDQWIEIWNLVFMQFERFADGRLEPLPKPSIDTGMGLERVSAVSSGLKSNYETSLLRPLIDKAAALLGKTYTAQQSADDVSLRVLADHARASAFLIADGVFPSNEGRGYVLRRIMRRAIRHGERLGFDEVFFYKITAEVVAQMGEVYPELRESAVSIEKWVRNEEEGFRRTLRTGLKLLSQRIEKLTQAGGRELGGADAFELYDTYGFPLDLTEVILREHGLTVDQAGFDKALDAQRARAGAFKNDGKGVADTFKQLSLQVGSTEFLGYQLAEERRGEAWVLKSNGAALVEASGERWVKCQVKALLQGGAKVDAAGAGEAEVVLDPTPFYGESGGQIGDRHGWLASLDGTALGRVTDTQKPVDGFHVSTLTLTAPLKVGDSVLARYDAALRHETRAHHSATHLLHKALRDVLGEHVKQAGSLVGPDKLRFDFSHFEALSPEQVEQIEAHVNQRVAQAAAVVTEVLDFEAAKKAGAVALFGEKYGDKVRVLSIADSKELCGGTHAFNTGDIGALRLTREEAVAAGVRRVEAVVGQAARALDNETTQALDVLAALLRGESAASESGRDEVKAIAQLVAKVKQARQTLGVAGEFVATTVAKAELVAVPAAQHRALLRFVTALRTAKGPAREQLLAKPMGQLPLVKGLVALLNEWDALDKKLDAAKSSQAGDVAATLVKKARQVGGVMLVAEVLDGVATKDLRTYADLVRDQLGSGVTALGVVADGKASIVVAVSKDLTARIKAGDVVKLAAAKIGGSGGGKPDLAQAGGPLVEGLEAALAAVAQAL